MLKFQFIPTSARANCIVLFALLAFALTGSSVKAEREIAWTDDFEGAVQRSATNNTVLLLHFYTDNCPPCRLLEKKTFHDPSLVETINQNVVPVRINADKRRDLATKYNITRWPTDVYLFPNGDEIYRGVSDQDPTVYTAKIKRIALRNRDWCVERASMAQAAQRRQDQAIAAHTPQIQPETPTYYGNVGHPVKTQSIAWSNPAGSVSGSHSAPPPTVPKKVIDNPFITQKTTELPNRNTVASMPNNTDSNQSTLYSQPTLPTAQKPAPTVQPAAQVVPPTTIARNLPATNFPQSQPNTMVNEKQATIPSIPVQTIGSRNAPSTSEQREALPPVSDHTTEINIAETIGMSGYCPVSLLESIEQNRGAAWVTGSPAYAVRHRGRIYYCASEKSRQTLLSNPDRYTPGLSGYDLVHFFKTGTLADGSCKYGCIQPSTNRIFLFANLENYQEFEREIERYAKMLEQMTPERVAVRASESPVR